ncbi:MAG: hypothetical protein EXR72_19490 [Myxococcales bacterium]|nr:hypothetical protein [Myxococcales bacterium]
MQRIRGAREAKRTVLAALLGGLILVGATGAARAGAGPWEFVREEDGIYVQRRKIEGSSLHEFQGRGVVEASIASILAVIADADHRTEWMHKCREARLVEQTSRTSQIAYNRTEAPWPVSDRDAVLLGQTTFDGREKRVRLDFHAIEYAKEPAKSGVVRMPYLKGHWILIPEHDGQWTRVEYQVHADPGGSLPNWVTNLVSKQIPFHTVANLRAQVKRRRYPEFEQWVTKTPEYQSVVAKASPAAAAAPTAAPAAKAD